MKNLIVEEYNNIFFLYGMCFRLGRNRSASTTLLEKVDHGNFRGSGWSVGHDPKSSTGICDY